MSIKPVLSFRGVFVVAILLCVLGIASSAFSGRALPLMLAEMFAPSAAAQEMPPAPTVETGGAKRITPAGVKLPFGTDYDGIVFGMGDLPLFGFQHLRKDKIYRFGGPTLLDLGSVNDFEPSWSPDGKKIVFVSLRDGPNPINYFTRQQYRNIYIMNADGTDQRRTGGSIYGAEYQPSFSHHTNPQDQRIVFAADYSWGGQSSGIYSMDTDGNNEILLTDGSECEPPAELAKWKKIRSELFPGAIFVNTPNYSPDDQFIIFGMGGEDGDNVYRINADGTGCTRIYTGTAGFRAAEARYSPDGTKIALYHSTGGGLTHTLRIINSTTGAVIQDIVPLDGMGNPNFSGTPVWDPSGAPNIAYLAGDMNPDNILEDKEIWTIDLDTEFTTQHLTSGVREAIRGLDWGLPSTAVPALSMRINEPHPLLGGTSTTGTLYLASPAPAGGATITLLAGNPVGQTVISLPSTIIVIPEGQTQADFQIDAPNRTDYRGIPIFASRTSPNASASASVSVWPSLPDLRAVSISGPASIAPGVAFGLNTSVDNIGQASTGGGWTDQVYFSIDDQFDATDSLIRTTNNSTALAAGATRNLTNLSTTISASVAPSAGQYYLFLRSNPNEAVNEGGRTANNIAMTTIQINLPDIVAENIVLPPVIQPGVTYPVSWTTRNAGTATSGTFSSRLYYSPDATLGDANDIQMASVSNNALAPNATQNHNVNINISTVPARPDGTAYFYVRADYLNNVYEGLPAGTGETNNTTTANTVFEYRVADLQVTSTVAPAEVETETAFAIEWTSTNAGNKAAGTFSERVYFSVDNQVGSDLLLGTFSLSGGLAAGASVNRIQNVTIATSAIPTSGNYYVYVQADSASQIDEGENENNNTRFQPVSVRRLLRPDLTVTNVTGPPTVFFDQTIQVQWTVTNSGQGPTNAPQWTDRLYIATSPTGAGGTTLKSTQSVSALNPGESYTASAIVKIPRGFNGAYHFVVKADVSGDLNEENTTNNLGSSQVQVNVPPLPDLIVETVQSPDEVFGGQEISINYTIKNVGTAAAGYHKERIYFSRDTTLNTGQDRLVFTSDGDFGPQIGQSVSYVSRNRIGNQVPPVYQLARVPSDMEGLWYVFVIADYRDDTYEFTNENNNINYDSVEPGAPINVLVTPPDLVVPNEPTAPATAASGTSFPVTFTVRNQGAFNAAPFLYHAVYLSTDQTFNSASDTLIGTFRDPDFFGPGAEHPMSINVGLPNCLADGTYYLFAVADYNGRQFEFDPGFDAEANNASPGRAIQLSTVPPDLQVTSFQVPPITMPGQSASISWTVSNLGGATTRNSVDRVYLRSTNPGIGAQHLGSFAHDGGLPAGGSYTETRSVGLPVYMEGEYYLTVTTDVSNTVPECGPSENNNTAQSGNFTIQNNLPDLVIDSVSAPSASVVGDSFNVQWTGRNANQGMPQSSRSWNDSVYLSTDQTFSNGDYYIGGAVNNLILAGGQTYSKQTQVSTGNIPAGTYYVLVYADTGSHIYESTGNSLPENNNVRASGPITLGLPAVDLQVGNVSVALPHQSGTFRDISWTVTNTGATQTLASSWSDYVILSRDSVLDASDTRLGYSVRSTALAGGASYTQTANLFIPTGLTGDYRVFVITDRNNNVVENNNSNNTSAPVTIDLTLPPPAELNITNITPPASISPGGNGIFAWTVQNTGSNAVNGRWRDTVYLSRDQFWDASDTLVGVRDLDSQTTSVPAGGGTYSPTQSFQVPPVEEGTYYVIVRTDSQNRIRESNEGNNVTTSISTTTVSITELQLNTPFNTTLGNGAQQFFKFVTDPDETLLFSLGTDKPARSNELFTKFDTMVSRADYDFFSTRPGEGNQENVITQTQDGDYYSMVRTDLIPESFANNFDVSPTKTAAEKSQNGVTFDPQNITVNARILPFSIRKVTPEEAGNTGYAALEVDGAKFVEGATLKLVGPTGTEISPGRFKVYPNRIIALFDLKGKPAGVYDIVVRNPNNATATLADGFTIINGGGAAEPRVTINGPGSARGGRLRYTISVANDGLNDLLLVPIIITVPSQYTYELDQSNNLGDFTGFLGPDAVPSQLPKDYVQEGIRIIPLFTPLLASRRSVNVNIDITVPFGFSNFEVTAFAMPPLENWLALAQPEQTAFLNRQMAKLGSGTEAECSEKLKRCLTELLRSVIFTAISEVLPAGCVGAAWGLALGVADLTWGLLAKAQDGQIGISDAVGSLSGLLASTLGALASECLEDAVPWFKAVSLALFAFKTVWDLWDCYSKRDECLPPPPEVKPVSFPFSIDPNEKIGPEGYGAERFVPVGKPLEYRINFENLPDATAPAQLVRITDSLPPPLDLRTVRLKEIGFKQYRFVVPANQSFYQSRVQLGEDLGNLQADILAGVDLVNNRVFWNLQAIDPQTSEAPLDPFAGLLPPNNANRDGEGYVIFTVEAKASFANRTVIGNSATIIFDQNEPIITNTTANLLDSVVPTSQMAALPATIATDEFDISWAGTDDTDGSGFAGHSIFYSEVGGAYQQYLFSPSGTTATFIGRWGKSYRFYSSGRDNAGNIEMPPLQPDATITILGGDTESDLSPRPNGNDGVLDGGDTDQVRRFVAGLDSDFTYNEFQRADMSPRDGGGNGTLSVADIMQARRYVAGLDTKADAAGPNEPSGLAPKTVGGKKAAMLPRELKPERVTRVGNQLHVGVRLEAQGDETGVGFTLNFDPAVLSNPTATLGPDAAGGVLTVNTAQAATGKVGITIDKAPANPFAAGSKRVVTVVFDVALGATAPTEIGFGDAPVLGEVVDGLANSLTTTFTPAMIPLIVPTSAGVAVSGHVRTLNGDAIRNARVSIVSANGETRTALTNTFGSFRFEDIAAGQSYTLMVRAKGYVFASSVIAVNDDIADIDLRPESSRTR